MDYAVRLISLEDDPDLPIFTLRMLFLPSHIQAAEN